MNRCPLARAAYLLLALLLSATAARAQDGGGYRGAEALGLALRHLGTTARVLMIAAHPDDENTQLLSDLALEHGADVAYLSLTRGEGGQNGVGPELGPALGLLRTEELLAARRLDGAQQFFSRAYDFGFSKNADEAFRHWPRDSLLADVVGVIRQYRPDVVIPVFSGTPADGHGQHQVSGILAREAFRAAADPRRFPEQIAAGLRPWQPRKLYQALWRNPEQATLRVPVGELDPLLGRSPFQIAMASRSRHRSQDMGQLEPAGPRWVYLRLLATAGGHGSPAADADPSVFAGVDTTLAAAGIAGVARVSSLLTAYDTAVRRIRAAWNPLHPEALVPELSRAAALLARADSLLTGDTGDAAADLRFRIAAELGDAHAALADAAGLKLDAVASREQVAPGDTFTVAISLLNGGARPVGIRALAPALPAGWRAEPLDALPPTLAPDSLRVRRFRVSVPADAAPTEPYFLRRPRVGDLYSWPDDWRVRARPFAPPVVQAAATTEVDGALLPLDAEATAQELDPRQGELRRPVRVVPAVAVTLDPQNDVLSTAPDAPDTLRFRVTLRAYASTGIAGMLRLVLPPGWRADSAAVPVRFAAPGERVVEWRVHAPAGVAAGAYPVRAEFVSEDGRRFAEGFQLVDYPHVRPRPLPLPALSEVHAFDVRVPRGLRVGYIVGAGEAGPEVLAPLGITPTPLDADALRTGDLSRFDVIVAGSRAYEVRPELAAANRRLLAWVRRGGTLLVQYNKYEFAEGGFAPYPLSMARPHDRVTDEAAPVTLLQPDHPVLSRPNRITEGDFAGWIQDRGLYFAHSWDSHYTPLLEMHDPGDPPLRGGLLVARYGQGWYVYTGLAFFRQLPEGVPGAYRLFANLLALGRR